MCISNWVINKYECFFNVFRSVSNVPGYCYIDFNLIIMIIIITINNIHCYLFYEPNYCAVENLLTQIVISDLFSYMLLKLIFTLNHVICLYSKVLQETYKYWCMSLYSWIGLLICVCSLSWAMRISYLTFVNYVVVVSTKLLKDVRQRNLYI